MFYVVLVLCCSIFVNEGSLNKGARILDHLLELIHRVVRARGAAALLWNDSEGEAVGRRTVRILGPCAWG
jgi:hypothetical protein